MSDKTVIEVNGIKLEVDLRYARRIEEMRIGDRVKVLKVEVVHAADEDFHVDRDMIVAKFDREIAAKEREIETITEQKRYFEKNFRAFWQRVEAEAR